ncbi:hypothetical protein OIB37_27855 [Streptomyces sp. NBC_00820]|uniref:hypothetical protein n=1 Tax=Streptomyces sp. NBC_00820 TaxID=2975842 RepID=UPI002ED58B9B|nr:hypothetical protein OIB37_27855 [Streptomyces sp. NBC_00820]
MGVLYDYFHAADQATAVDWAIGPAGDRLNGRSLDEAGADWFDAKNMDPNVVLGQLVAFAEGIPFGSLTDPEMVWPDPVEWPYGRPAPSGTESPWDTGLVLQQLPDGWRDALAGVVEDAVPMLALQWYDIEEIRFADFLHAQSSVRTFVGLARRARAARASLYCRCVV